MLAVLPLISKVLFSLAILTLVITAVIEYIKYRSYLRELKDYRHRLSKKELESIREKRLRKESEVIRLYNENMRQAVTDDSDAGQKIRVTPYDAAQGKP